MNRLIGVTALFFALVLSACGDTGGDTSEAMDGSMDPDQGAVADAGVPPSDTEVPDSGDADPDSADAALPEDAEPPIDAAPPPIDAAPIDECEMDNGGCGDPAVWRCIDTPRTPPDCVFDESSDYLAITDGASTILSGNSLPDSMVLYGPTAFVVALDEQAHPFMAAARVGDGKMFHVGHETHLRFDGVGTSHRLLFNVLEWITGGDLEAVIGVEQGVNINMEPVTTFGYTVRSVPRGAFEGLSLYIGNTYGDFDEATVAAYETFLAEGGGLITAGHAWWWAQNNDSPAATHFAGNAILSLGGIVLTGWGDVEADTDEVSAMSPGPLHNALYAFAALVRHNAGTLLAEARLATATYAVARALRALPIDGPFFTNARSLLDEGEPIVPTRDTPLVHGEQPVAGALAQLEIRLALDTAPEATRVSASAADYPGAVPGDAVRGSVTLEVDGSYAGRDGRYAFSQARSPAWRSTGRYAAPGEIITVTIPEAAVDAGLEVQVGCHTDTLFNRDEWHRMPRIVNQRPLDAVETRIANGFGGPIYIRVPIGAALGNIEVVIDGAVEMPRYVHGSTDLADWRDRIRQAPAPWAEIAGEKMIITIPSAAVRDLDDPADVAALWDSVLDASADLAGIPPERARAERFVVDRQIGGGWMHSGYPLMAHVESTTELLDTAAVRARGAWGPFHEIGHNHQWVEWVLPGTVESSVNLWSVYISETLFGVDRALAHEALTPAARAQRMADYLNNGARFEEWSVWTALETYLQLQEAFGWAPFTALFQEYRELPPGTFPDDQTKIDQWVIRSARAFGRDLGPFYTAWGLPVSDDALRSAAELPAWDEDPMN